MKIQIEEADLRSVLTALEEIHPGNMTPMAEGAWNKAITAIREALSEQPSSKPLSGYINAAGINANDSPHIVVEKLERVIEAKLREKNAQPSKPWVGLTADEMEGLYQLATYMDETDYIHMLMMAEAKLKEKNNG